MAVIGVGSTSRNSMVVVLGIRCFNDVEIKI